MQWCKDSAQDSLFAANWPPSQLPSLITASISLHVMSKLLLIERVLTGKAEPGDVTTIVRTYTNFIPRRSSLQRHLESLKELCGSDQSYLSEVFKKLRDVHEKNLDVLFKDVIMLARIYMACPVASVECERSFSMCRLKTWLRRTTGQSRTTSFFSSFILLEKLG